MERSAFTLLHEMEDSWWYRGRKLVVEQVLKALPLSKERRLLDFGAGFGGMRDVLSPYGVVSAFEPDAEAREAATQRGYTSIVSDIDGALAGTYGLIGLFDVLEHIEDDRAFLRKLKGSLEPGGIVVLTVPAMPYLWSEHDISHHHFRRYTRSSLSNLLREEGYAVDFISHWNMFLFLPAALARALGKSGEGALHLPRIVATCFVALIRIEAMLMHFMSLPFGVSLVVRARNI